MSYNFFANPLQTLYSKQTSLPPLSNRVLMTSVSPIRSIPHVYIQANENTIVGRTSRLITVYDRKSVSLYQYHLKYKIYKIKLSGELMFFWLYNRISVLDLELHDIVHFDCEMAELLDHSHYGNMHIVSFVLYKRSKVKVVDVVIHDLSYYDVTVRLYLDKRLIRPIICSNGLLILDDNVYDLERDYLVYQPQDYRPYYVCAYARTYGHRLSWQAAFKRTYRINNEFVEFQVLSNTFCCEVTKNRQQKATFLTFLSANLVGVHFQPSRCDFTVYIIGTKQVNIVTLNTDLEISGRIQSAGMDILPTERICCWFLENDRLCVTTTFGRIFGSSKISKCYDLVLYSLARPSPSLSVNMPNKTRFYFYPLKKQVDSLDFLLK